MKKILIATTNKSKFDEIIMELADLKYEFLNLKNVGLEKEVVAENYQEGWHNALVKARYYAKKSKLLTIADDTGFYVKYLHGAPGIKAKRYAATSKERNKKILKALSRVPKNNREARFVSYTCVYNPKNNQFASFEGACQGVIAGKEIGTSKKNVGYDSIFYYPPSKKTYAQMTTAEKNLVSHRGQVLVQLRNYINRQFNLTNLVVPLGVVVKNKKMLMLKRRDHRKKFNNKWEFPGGIVEDQETVEQAVIREVKEETGFNVKIVDRIKKIYFRAEMKFGYQVFLPVFICKINSGKLSIKNQESIAYAWVTIKEALGLDLLPQEHYIFKENNKLLKQYTD